jgi:alcohol dehydrogenase
MKKLGYQDKVVELLAKNNVSCVIYDKVQPNPTRKGTMEAAALAKSEGCDFTLGLGGGSSIDTAKSAAIMMKNPGDLWDYAYAGTGKKKPIMGAAPIVTITTTAGTGTEVDPWCVITNEETGEKLDFFSNYIFPTFSIIDPELMCSVPASLTAFQGIDAFCHALEGYIASVATPLSDLFALKAIELVTKYLPEAVDNGQNIEARENISYAANVLCGFVQSLSSCTSPHLLGQTMGGLYPKLPHGTSLIVLLKAYYKVVADKLPDKFAEVAKAMGEDVDSMQEKDRPKAFLSALDKLLVKCHVDQIKMSDYGVQKQDIEKIAKLSIDIGFDLDRYTLTLEDVISILEESYQ